MNLIDRLNEIAINHRNACLTLVSFVRDMSRGLEETKALNTNLLTFIESSLAEASPDSKILITLDRLNETAEVTPKIAKSIYEAINMAQTHQQQFPHLLLEMAFIYRVALYDAFIPDVIKAVLISQPQLLRSEKTVTHMDILDHSNMTTLIDHMIEKELHNFSFASVEKQAEWIQKRLHVKLIANDTTLKQLIEYAARRNLFVHANGISNGYYLRSVPNSSCQQGERLTVEYAYFNACHPLLQEIAQGLLNSVCERYCDDATPPSLQDPAIVKLSTLMTSRKSI